MFPIVPTEPIFLVTVTDISLFKVLNASNLCFLSSFHVGSGCQNASAFGDAVVAAHKAFLAGVSSYPSTFTVVYVFLIFCFFYSCRLTWDLK